MRLAEFIRSRRADVVRHWKRFAKTHQPSDSDASDLVLTDHVEDLVDAITLELDAPMIRRCDEPDPSGGVSPPGLALLEAAARIHTTERMQGGYALQQIVAEYRALRASLVRMWRDRPDPTDRADDALLDRLNDVFDEIIQASVAVYTSEIARSRDLLLGTLGHDLRKPLNAIAMRAAVLARMPLPREAQDVLAPMRGASLRMNQLIGDLLDVTRVRLGSGLDLNRVHANLGTLCAQSMEEVQSAYASNLVRIHSTGDLRGFWDTTRIYQALTNLLGNAIQHGKPNAPEMLARIFEPMLRVQAQVAAQPASTDSVGLGLYIAKEIISAHGGTLAVASNEANGTTFTICLARHLDSAAVPSGVEAVAIEPPRKTGTSPLC